MIILSVGMPRAGSGWYYNLTNDLMLADGAQDARQIRRRYHLESILTEVNCNIGALTPRRLLMVMLPALLGSTFVIKAHAGPTPLARGLMRTGLLKVAYIYRDPRDAMLSAYEYGQRARRDGRQNAFSPLIDFDSSLDFILEYVHIWEAWMACEGVLHTRYEALLSDYDAEAGRLVEFLPLQAKRQSLAPIIARYRPESASRDAAGLHFSKGRVGRYRQKWDPQQQTRLQSVLGSYLARMGYDSGGS
jgi:hypothetical protein